MEASEQLAQGFVECTTEYDWAELPVPVREQIMAGAAAMLRWMNPPTIVIGPVSGDGLARHKEIHGRTDGGIV